MSTETKPSPGKPQEVRDPNDFSLDEKHSLYKLLYRTGKMADSMEFKFEGTLREAIDEGRKYCTLRRLAFLNVSPLYADITAMNTYYAAKGGANMDASLANRIPGQVY